MIMKKISNLLFVSLLAAIFAACGDNNVLYQPVEPLEVISADVQYPVKGGEGVIVVNADKVSAKCTNDNGTSDVEWVKVSVSGNKVNVTVDENVNFNQRNAKVLLASADGKQTTVTLTQAGIVYGLEGETNYEFDNAARKFSIGIIHEDEIILVPSADWITATYNATTGNIDISLTKNETGWKREGYVDIYCGSQHDVIYVSQFDIKEAMLGEYDFVYYNTTQGGWYYYPAELTETSLKITRGAYEFEIPVTIDYATGTISAGPCSSYIGKYSSYFVYLMFGSAEGYWTGYNNTTSLSTATYEIYEDEESGNVYLDFEFGGTFGNYSIDYWNFQALKAQEFVSTNSLGYLDRCYYPYLEKVVIEGDPQGAKPHKAKKASAEDFILTK